MVFNPCVCAQDKHNADPLAKFSTMLLAMNKSLHRVLLISYIKHFIQLPLLMINMFNINCSDNSHCLHLHLSKYTAQVRLPVLVQSLLCGAWHWGCVSGSRLKGEITPVVSILQSKTTHHVHVFALSSAHCV